MKINKLSGLVFICLTVILLFSVCDDTDYSTLWPEPDSSKIRISADKSAVGTLSVSWDAVEGAAEYEIIFKRTDNLQTITAYVPGNTTTCIQNHLMIFDARGESWNYDITVNSIISGKKTLIDVIRSYRISLPQIEFEVEKNGSESIKVTWIHPQYMNHVEIIWNTVNDPTINDDNFRLFTADQAGLADEDQGERTIDSLDSGVKYFIWVRGHTNLNNLVYNDRGNLWLYGPFGNPREITVD